MNVANIGMQIVHFLESSDRHNGSVKADEGLFVGNPTRSTRNKGVCRQLGFRGSFQDCRSFRKGLDRCNQGKYGMLILQNGGCEKLSVFTRILVWLTERKK